MEAPYIQPKDAGQDGKAPDSIEQLRSLIGTETADKVASALRLMSLRSGVKKDMEARHYYYETAKLFAAVSVNA